MNKLSFRRYTLSVTVTALILSEFILHLQAQTATSTYASYRGRDTKTIPPAPALGPANSVIDDPTFASRILRVTDSNTNAGESFISTDAGNHRAWNADSTAIKLTGPHGDGYWMEFDPNSFVAGDGSTHPQFTRFHSALAGNGRLSTPTLFISSTVTKSLPITSPLR